MIHTDQIPQSCGDTYIVCVCLVSRYQIDQFYPVSVSLIIFYAGGRYKLLHQWKMRFSCSNPSRLSIQRENNEKLVVFDVFIDTWCLVEISNFGYGGFLQNSHDIGRKFSPTPSGMGINTWSTSPVDFSTHSGYVDKPSWCPTNWERFQRILRSDGFVTTPVPFNVNLPPKSWFLVI